MNLMNHYSIMILILAITYINAENVEPFFKVSKNLIINTTDDSILYSHIVRLPIYCVWYCVRNEDCFAVNSIPIEGSYTCELLPVLVETYDIISSFGGSYYSKYVDYRIV